MDVDHTAPSVQNPLQRQRVQKTGTVRDETTCKETIIPQSPWYSPSYDIPDRFSQKYKLEKEWNERMEHLNDKYNLHYYSSSELESESEHKYETLI